MAPWMQVDSAALHHNLRRVRQLAPHSRVLAMLKANAYGHGLGTVARCLTTAVDAYAVARLPEAVSLRTQGITQRLVLLSGPETAHDLAEAAHLNLDWVVHSPYQVELLEQAAPSTPLRIWLKFDTGMHRLGLPLEAAAAVVARLQRLTGLSELLLMTHLAASDDRTSPTTALQLEAFQRLRAQFPALASSAANSGAILGWPASHLDWVRPGIMLYGVSPYAGRCGVEDDLRPVMQLNTRLLAVYPRQAGDRIGYGGTGRCPVAMPVGVAAIGYGDGYPRQLGNRGWAWVNGQRAPLLGRVSMDLLTLDLRACPDACPGDPVLLWGTALPVEHLAAVADTIAYELLCQVNARSVPTVL